MSHGLRTLSIRHSSSSLIGIGRWLLLLLRLLRGYMNLRDWRLLLLLLWHGSRFLWIHHSGLLHHRRLLALLSATIDVAANTARRLLHHRRSLRKAHACSRTRTDCAVRLRRRGEVVRRVLRRVVHGLLLLHDGCCKLSDTSSGCWTVHYIAAIHPTCRHTTTAASIHIARCSYR